MTKTEKAVAILVFIAVMAITFFWIFASEISRYSSELFNLTYQFLLLVVGGGGIGWLYKELTASRDRENAAKKEFLEFRAEIVNAYHEYKAIKRLLRAKAKRRIEGDEIVIVSAYEILVTKLNSLQLEFETFIMQVKGNEKQFLKVNELYTNEDQGQDLKRDLKVVEKYLNTVVHEYETALAPYADTPERIELSKLPALKAFIAGGPDIDDSRLAAQNCLKSAVTKLAHSANGNRLSNDVISNQDGPNE